MTIDTSTSRRCFCNKGPRKKICNNMFVAKKFCNKTCVAEIFCNKASIAENYCNKASVAETTATPLLLQRGDCSRGHIERPLACPSNGQRGGGYFHIIRRPTRSAALFFLRKNVTFSSSNGKSKIARQKRHVRLKRRYGRGTPWAKQTGCKRKKSTRNCRFSDHATKRSHLYNTLIRT
jgi:hypothetical protein